MPDLPLDPPPPLHHDTLWRALARRGQVRLAVARMTLAVREAVQRQGVHPAGVAAVAELLVATRLVQSLQGPEERWQFALRHDGALGQLAADVWEDGGVRAFVQRPQPAADLPAIGQGVLQVARRFGEVGRAWHGAVPFTGEVAVAVERYLLESEQIPSVLRLEVGVAQGRVTHALGWLVQVLPEGTRADLATVLDHLTAAGPLHAAMTPEDPDGRAWAARLLQGLDGQPTAREPVAFACRCSEAHMRDALLALPAADRDELARQPVDVTCEWCKRVWRVDLADLPA